MDMFRMVSPPSGKEGWLKAGVVGAPISNYYLAVFSYHLPLRVLLLPEGGEAMQHTYETAINDYFFFFKKSVYISTLHPVSRQRRLLRFLRF